MIHERYPRRRLPLALTLLLVIAAGLGSRSFPLLPATLGKYPGDALWALMILLGLALVRPGIRPSRLALLALACSWAVELSQLYRAPWINSMRATRLGHLALGSAFQWPDLLSYAVGIFIGFAVDRAFFHRAPQTGSSRVRGALATGQEADSPTSELR